MDQPTFAELNLALSLAIKESDIANLRIIRDAKTQWYGPDENALRFAIDLHLRENNG